MLEYGDSKQGQQRGNRKKIAALKKLNNEYLNISLSFSFPFDYVFNYDIFARDDDMVTSKCKYM